MFMMNEMPMITTENNDNNNQIYKKIKYAKDLYNDIEIMLFEPPYPFIPISVGNFYKENTFEIELIEYVNDEDEIIDYSIGKEGIASVTHTNLKEVIKAWNNYCCRIHKEQFYDKLSNFKKLILQIIAVLAGIFLIAGRYELIVILVPLYGIINYLLLPQIFDPDEYAKKEMSKIIEGYIRNNSSQEIKFAISSPMRAMFPPQVFDTSDKDKVIETLENVLKTINKFGNISLESINENKEIITNITLYNTVNQLLVDYKNQEHDNQNTQYQKDIIYYSKNFIKALNIIYKYQNRSDELKKEVNELICNYYLIFKYFNNTLLQNDELTDITKLKVLNQDSKLYKDFINIKQ